MRSRTSTLLSFMVLALGLAVQSAPASPLSIERLGPFAERTDSYVIGREHLRLKALLVGSTLEKDVEYAVKEYRRDPGTNSWDWKIGYRDLAPGAEQSLVLAWYNLDTSEQGWLAVRIDKSRQWQEMSNHTGRWAPFVKKNLLHKETTNGSLVVTRFSRVSDTRAAYAFSRTARFLDMTE